MTGAIVAASGFGTFSSHSDGLLLAHTACDSRISIGCIDHWVRATD
jgi:hypothetical protein